MRTRFIVVVVSCVACSSGGTTDAGMDATSDVAEASCIQPISDAALTCDVSSVPTSALTCGDWVGTPTQLDGGGKSCPAAYNWDTGFGSVCTYTWSKPGSPNLCELPSSLTGASAFTWLHPACDAGCP